MACVRARSVALSLRGGDDASTPSTRPRESLMARRHASRRRRVSYETRRLSDGHADAIAATLSKRDAGNKYHQDILIQPRPRQCDWTASTRRASGLDKWTRA